MTDKGSTLNPFGLLDDHYKHLVGRVISAVECAAFQMTEDDIVAIERACSEWVSALRGILRVKQAILDMVGVEEQTEDIFIPAGTMNATGTIDPAPSKEIKSRKRNGDLLS